MSAPAARAAVTVRPATDADRLDEINRGSVVWYGEAPLREMAAATPRDVPHALLVAVVDGVPAGFANTIGAGVTDGHRGLAYVHVVPAHRGRGVGSALWREVLAVCTPERVRGVSTRVDEADTTSLAIATSHGLVPRGLHVESELDLSTIEHLRPLSAAPRAPGVELRNLPEDADEELWHRFAAKFTELMADTPDRAEGGEPMPYPVVRAVLQQPWQVMCAWRGDRVVGLTALGVRNRETGLLNTFLTAVDHDLRGLGIATALKVGQALQVRDAGWSRIATQNMEGNDAILAANRRLGFVPVAALRDLTYDYR
jgi:GNAT superfamily N-acetyltransferase